MEQESTKNYNKNFYLANALVTVKISQFVAIIDSNQKKMQIIVNKSWSTILEIFIHEHSLEAAYQRFGQINCSPSEHLLNQCIQVRYNLENFLLLLANKELIFF